MKHPLFRDDALEAFYEAVAATSRKRSHDALEALHIPVSEVFYIRAVIEADTGIKYPLSHVEEALYLEGYIAAEDCFANAKHYAWQTVSVVL